MTTFDDDEIEFDFFDEPETAEAAPRGRRLPRLDRPGGRGSGDGPRRPRRPLRAPTGIVPLARLVGLIAIAIVVVVAFVFWVGACQGKSKHDEYAAYAAKVRTLATSSTALGKEFGAKLVSSSKQTDLEANLQQYAQQEQQAYDQALQIRAPGPLRDAHRRALVARRDHRRVVLRPRARRAYPRGGTPGLRDRIGADRARDSAGPGCPGGRARGDRLSVGPCRSTE